MPPPPQTGRRLAVLHYTFTGLLVAWGGGGSATGEGPRCYPACPSSSCSFCLIYKTTYSFINLVPLRSLFTAEHHAFFILCVRRKLCRSAGPRGYRWSVRRALHHSSGWLLRSKRCPFVSPQLTRSRLSPAGKALCRRASGLATSRSRATTARRCKRDVCVRVRDSVTWRA
jgi:hypothetical protein